MNPKVWAAHVWQGRWVIFLGIALPLIEALIFLFRIVAPEGFVFYGDAEPITNPWLTLRQSLSLWNFQFQAGAVAPFIWSPFYLAYAILATFFGAATTSRILVVALAALPGVAMYHGSSQIYHHVHRAGWPNWFGVLFSLTASQAYELSFVNGNLTDPMNPWGMAYIALPLLFMGWWLIIVEGKRSGAGLLVLGSLISSMNPFWIEELVIVSAPVLLIYLPVLLQKVGYRVSLTRFGVAFAALVVANLFWIVPLAYEYHAGVAGYSPSNQPFSLESVEYLSEGYRLIDVVFYGHSTFYLFGKWSRNWGLLSLIPACTAIFPLLTTQRTRPLVLGLCVSLLVGLFLSKGTNPPFGFAFYWLALHLPFGFGELLRNGGSIFLGAVLFAASLLLAIGVLEIVYRASNVQPLRFPVAHLGLRWGRLKLHRTTTARIPVRTSLTAIIAAVMLLGVTYPLGAGMLQDQSVYGPRFVATEIPSGYSETEAFLEDHGFGYNVAWVPNGCCSVPYWKPYLLTNFPASISYETSVASPESYLSYAAVPGSNVSANWLSLLGLRYVILHNDFTGFPYAEWYDALSGSNEFAEKYSAGNLTVFEPTGPWVPSDVYALPTTADYVSGFPYFDGNTYLNLSFQGRDPSVAESHNASINSFAHFNGTSAAIAPDPLNFSSGQNFTIAAWVNTESTATQVIAQDNVYGGTWNGWILGLIDGKPYFQAGQTSYTQFQGLVANDSIADGQWHLLVGERAGTNWSIYVDGKLVAEKQGIRSISLISSQELSVGARVTTYGSNTWYFSGDISDVQAYGTALSAGEILSLSQGGLDGSYFQGLEEGWLLQQYEGTTAPSLLAGGEPLDLWNVTWSPLFASLNFAAGQNFAVGAWIRTTSATTQVIAQDNVYGGTWDGWILGLEDGKPYFQAGQTSNTQFQGLVGNFSVSNGVWTFLLGERIGETWYLYVDGQLAAEESNMTSIPIQTSQNASIGARVTSYGGNTWFFNGAIGDVQVYSEGLPTSEIRVLYDAGLNNTAPPVGKGDNVLYALTEAPSGVDIEDHSRNSFAVTAHGDVSSDVLPLPLYVGPTNSTAVRVVSATMQSPTRWTLQLAGNGTGTIVLANPYAPGWLLKGSTGEVAGHSIFSGLAIGFSITLHGQETVTLEYPPQDYLYEGIGGSAIGFGVVVLIMILWPSLLTQRGSHRRKLRVATTGVRHE